MESQRVRHDWAHTQSKGGRSDVRQRSSMWKPHRAVKGATCSI